MNCLDSIKTVEQDKLKGLFVSGDYKHGLYKEWWAGERGVLWLECEVENGIPHGYWKKWYIFGGLREHVVIEHGQIVDIVFLDSGVTNNTGDPLGKETRLDVLSVELGCTVIKWGENGKIIM